MDKFSRSIIPESYIVLLPYRQQAIGGFLHSIFVSEGKKIKHTLALIPPQKKCI